MTTREHASTNARSREPEGSASPNVCGEDEVSRLREQLRMAQAYLRIQANVARNLGSQVPMLRACRELALSVCHELGWDYAGVWTVDVPTWTLRCRDAWIRPGLPLAWFEQASRLAQLEPGSGLPGRAWLYAKPQWATDLDLDLERSPALPMPKILPPSAGKAGFRTAVSFPLKYGDDVLAVVDVFSRERRAPDPTLMAILEASGDQLALWELRERAEECARVAQADADDARARLESVLDCAPAVVLVIDRDYSIQFINRTLPQHRREDVIGKSWKTYVLPAHHARIEQALSEVLQTGDARSYEAAAPDEHGKPRWYLNHMGPIRSGGSITGAVVIAQDVTEAKLPHTELVEAQRLAAVGTLAAGVAHEINTPIQFVNDSIHFLREATQDLFSLTTPLLDVVGAAELRDQDVDLLARASAARDAAEAADLEYLVENVPRAFERAIEGLERVTTIVRSMKEFAHPAQKDMAPADLNRAIQSTLTVARNEYKYVADLEVDFGELPPVLCHVNDVNQVVLNIVVNAAHAIEEQTRGTDRRGLIRVTTRRDQDYAVITVADTGGGIPEAVRGRIFEPFFTTKEVGRGTGQGLSIARASVREKHGGDLFFETELGKGTTFTVRLPIAGPTSRGESAP